jgi:hypothetical protein
MGCAEVSALCAPFITHRTETCAPSGLSIFAPSSLAGPVALEPFKFGAIHPATRRKPRLAAAVLLRRLVGGISLLLPGFAEGRFGPPPPPRRPLQEIRPLGMP